MHGVAFTDADLPDSLPRLSGSLKELCSAQRFHVHGLGRTGGRQPLQSAQEGKRTGAGKTKPFSRPVVEHMPPPEKSDVQTLQLAGLFLRHSLYGASDVNTRVVRGSVQLPTKQNVVRPAGHMNLFAASSFKALAVLASAKLQPA
jgi:hypothetical protein